MKRVQPAAAGAVALVSLLAAACGGSAAPKAQPSGAPVDVNFATANNMLHTPEFVALEKGFYLKHGIRAKFQVFNSGAEINKAVAAGTMQVGGGGDTATPTAISAGIPIFTFAPYMQDATTSTGDEPLAIVARTDSGIRPGDWASFVGKRVGLVTGGTGDAYFRAGLAQAGVDVQKVTIQNLQPGDMLAAMQGKQVDAISSWEPYQTQILDQMGSQAVLFKRGGGLIGYVLGEGASQDWANQHPALVQDISDAIAEATYWTRTHPDQAAVIATHWIPGLDAKVAKDAIKHIPFDPRVTGCTTKDYADSTALLVQQGKIKQNVPTGQMIVSRYTAKTQQENPQWYKDLKPVSRGCPN
ncbi:MAG: ABC transporter substrate-binding protein [Candidatus Dormibacteraeota bacterium]|nr:ABC transporter substrate-binding protein [Candidatus Dormibacteraeota bacterium]